MEKKGPLVDVPKVRKRKRGRKGLGPFGNLSHIRAVVSSAQ